MSVKAFELVPVIEKLQLLGEKVQTKIECIECCDKYLYVGTSDSFIVLFSLEEQQHPDGIHYYTSKKEKHKYLEMKKPILGIRAASALNRLLVLCDSYLLLLNMENLEPVGGTSKVRGISAFCVNENPYVSDPFCTQICCCISGKRQLQVYNVTAEKVAHVKEVTVAEQPIALAMDGIHICVALQTHYAIYDFETNSSMQLFSYGTEQFLPLIKRITKEEFLLSAPEGLGMFVTTAGISTRPPIQWSYPLLSLAYVHPYILGVSDEMIVIYSILDQQQKQALSFAGGQLIGNFDGRVLVSSSSSVYGLAPIPWENQVEVLLADCRVEEALELAKNVTRGGMTKAVFLKTFERLQQKAAFIYFSQGLFDKAAELFESGHVDFREIISLYPDLLPSSSQFIRSIPPLHGIANVGQLFNKDADRLQEAYAFLKQFLERNREMSMHLLFALEVDTALIKLYAKDNSIKLEPLIVTGEIACDIKECSSWLENHGCYHALALLCRQSDDAAQALHIWAKIISGEYKDDNFKGLEFFAEVITNLTDLELVWRYADFILGLDEDLGVKIFTDRPASDLYSAAIDPNVIVDFLHRHPLAVIKYLEHLVMVKEIPVEKFHTHLAVLYLEKILDLKREGNEEAMAQIRFKLRALLQKSNLYRVQLLLGKMQDAELFQEAAILFGKIEEHEKALSILVYHLKDFESAEEYCVTITKEKDFKYKQYLYELLLNTYLNPKSESDSDENYLVPALHLLNDKATEFDAAKVLEMMPSTWSITVIEPFLRAALRKSLHKYRMTKMASSLARGENLQKQFALYDLQKNAVHLYTTNYCVVCKKPFSGCSFARYPNNIIIHTDCVRHSTICPVTGKNFKGLR